MYRVSHAFSVSSGGITAGSGAIGSMPFVGASIMPVMALDVGASAMSSMLIRY
jgi:hypothetical protein